MGRFKWEIGFVVLSLAVIILGSWRIESEIKSNRSPCQIVTIAVPGPVAVIRVDGSTILVNEKEFTLPAGDTRFTVRVMDSKSP